MSIPRNVGQPQLKMTLLENAVHSLEAGISAWSAAPPDQKLALLLVFHAAELVLKQALAEINPVLIYANIDKEIGPRSRTVDFGTACKRLKNLSVDVDDGALAKLQEWRNQVQHYEFTLPPSEVQQELATALKFILRFLESRLKKKPEQLLQMHTWFAVSDLVRPYDERCKEAEAAILTRFGKDADVQRCPTCMEYYLDETGHCHFCDNDAGPGKCTACGAWLASPEPGACDNCTWQTEDD